MIDYDNLKHHPLSEKLVTAVADKVGTAERAFFRVHVAFYLTVVASMMRCAIKVPGSAAEPVNMFAMNLAPSGFGKGHSTAILEEQVIHLFRQTFLNQTMPAQAEISMAKMALQRAKDAGEEEGEGEEIEMAKLKAIYNDKGPMAFSFDSGSSPALKQLRDKLILAGIGALNLQTDEIGSNLLANKEANTLYLELYSGRTKIKLIKQSRESARSEDLQGIVPSNMMAFGVPSGLFDDGKVQEELYNMYAIGYARRTHVGYVSEETVVQGALPTPSERLAKAMAGNSDLALGQVAEQLEKLANLAYLNKVLSFPDDTSLLLFEYQNHCIERAQLFDEHQGMEKAEMTHRHSKAAKIAGAYAFADQAPEVTPDHYLAAIAFTEECGRSFHKMFTRDASHVKLAKFLTKHKGEVTPVELLEKVPSYKGTQQQRQQIMAYAVDWGYKNNLLIKTRYGTNGIPFIRGEHLESTNLERMILSHSTDITHGYKPEFAPWNKLHMLMQAPDRHWVNHHVELGHRHDDHVLPGFNMLVLDVDKEISLPMARQMFEGYKALFYTTKRHTEAENRFRIILPTNFILKMEMEEFKLMMKNIFEWVPVPSDEQTGQRSRKWMTNPGHYEYQEGQLFDILPFIPATTKNEELKQRLVDMQNLDALERWVVSTAMEAGRNNQLHKYARILVDGGLDFNQIQDRMLALNEKLPDRLTVREVNDTFMTTAAKQISLRDAA